MRWDDRIPGEWKQKFAYFPQQITDNITVWWEYYEERTAGSGVDRRLPGSDEVYRFGSGFL